MLMFENIMHQFEVYFLPRLFPKIAKPIDINIKSSFKNVHPSADFPEQIPVFACFSAYIVCSSV